MLSNEIGLKQGHIYKYMWRMYYDIVYQLLKMMGTLHLLVADA